MCKAHIMSQTRRACEPNSVIDVNFKPGLLKSLFSANQCLALSEELVHVRRLMLSYRGSLDKKERNPQAPDMKATGDAVRKILAYMSKPKKAPAGQDIGPYKKSCHSFASVINPVTLLGDFRQLHQDKLTLQRQVVEAERKLHGVLTHLKDVKERHHEQLCTSRAAHAKINELQSTIDTQQR